MRKQATDWKKTSAKGASAKELLSKIWASQVVLIVKNPPANAGDTRDAGSIPGSGRSPGVRNGNQLQYSCLDNSMDRGLVGYNPRGHRESDTTEHVCTNLL